MKNSRQAERREHERKNLLFYLRVLDESSENFYGRAINFSAKGLMMLSDSAITIDSRWRLRLKLPAVTCNHEDLVFDAYSRWCQKDLNPHLYVTGFQLCFARKKERHESKTFLEKLNDFQRHCRGRHSPWNYVDK